MGQVPSDSNSPTPQGESQTTAPPDSPRREKIEDLPITTSPSPTGDDRNVITTVSSPTDGGAESGQRSPPPVQLTKEEISTLITSANTALVDNSALARKYAMQAIIRILAVRDLNALSRKPLVLDSVCLALSLNVLSADVISQSCALAGLRILSTLSFCVPALVKSEAESSIVNLLQRPLASDEALRTALRVLRNLVEVQGESNVLWKQKTNSDGEDDDAEFISRLLKLGERLGGSCIEHSLLVISSAPPKVYTTCYDDIWQACSFYLRNITTPIPQVLRLSGLIAVRQNDFLREIASDDELFACFLDNSLTEKSALVALIASGNLAAMERNLEAEKRLAIAEACVRALRNGSFGDDTVIRGVRELVESSYSWCSALESQGVLDSLSQEVHLHGSNAETSFAIALAIAMSPCHDVDVLSKRKAFFELLSAEVFEDDIQLLVDLGRIIIDGSADQIGLLEGTISSAMKHDDAIVRAAGACVLSRRLDLMQGWIRAGLLKSSRVGLVDAEMVPVAFEREEDQENNENYFAWKWNGDLVSSLAQLARDSRKENHLERVHVLEALSRLSRVEGPDRVDGLEIQASWEGLDQRVAVNTACPELFRVGKPQGNDVSKVRLFVSPREMRAGVFDHEESMIAFNRLNPPGKQDEWTVTAWVKQTGVVLSGSEPMRPRTILGVAEPPSPSSSTSSSATMSTHPSQPAQRSTTHGSLLSIDDQFMLGFQPPVALALFRPFGPWEQLSSGWHHVVVTCKEQKNIAGLDLLLGRTRVISCYVDGQRLGVPIACTPLECPSIASGIVLGNDWAGSTHLGGEFVLGEVRVFSTCLSERTIASSVARSSFNRRPNWNSTSVGNSRLTPAHTWARMQLAECDGLALFLVDCLKDDRDDDVRRLAAILCMHLLTVPAGRKALFNAGIVAACKDNGIEETGDDDLVGEVVKMLKAMADQ